MQSKAEPVTCLARRNTASPSIYGPLPLPSMLRLVINATVEMQDTLLSEGNFQ